MSAPFVYGPHAEHYPAPYWARPYNPSFGTPFPPPGETVYPSSPFPSTLVPDAGTPNTPERVLYSGLNDYGWGTPYARRRRFSWPGPSAPPIAPFIPPTPTTPFAEPLERCRSWDRGEAPPAWSTAAAASASHYPPIPAYYPAPLSAPAYAAPLVSSYVPAYPLFPPPMHIHPFLNGDVLNEMLFDLSISAFTPQRRFGPEQAIPLTGADFQQPAFQPPVTRLRIVCDLIPQWPIDLAYPAAGGAVAVGMAPAPPITLGDILVAVHQKAHQRITHEDWARLAPAEEAGVARAFTRRCKLETIRRRNAGYVSASEIPERQQGVKIVDYLRGRHYFRGLVRSEDGYVKLVLSDAW